MSAILFSTLGTLGDVRPFLALAITARSRGHQVRVATSPRFGPMVEENGLDFVRIGVDDYLDRQDGRDAMIDPQQGFENFMRFSNLEPFEAVYGPLALAAHDAEVMVSSPFVMPAHLATAGAGIPLVLGVLSPASVRPPEGRDNSQLPVDFLAWRRVLNARRLELGLPTRPAPQMERLTAAELALGLYPSLLSDVEGGQTLPVTEVGYPFLRQDESLPPELEAWMDQGPFALFSFGSFVDRDAPRMFAESWTACRRLDLRCLYVSPFSAERLGHQSPDVRVEQHVPHPLAMPRAAVVVHHGGTGTLAEACEAGAAQVVVPFALDQIYNARRLAEQGLAQIVPAGGYRSEDVATAIAAALSGPHCDAGSVSAANAAERAVSLIEDLMARSKYASRLPV